MAPRVFCIPAARAPVLAVIRRGPTRWSHLGAWDIGRRVYEPGAWLAGTLYPQRCDLSPDGRWFAYFTLKASPRWGAGGTYVAISRLPWLTALAAWPTCGTWTAGVHFVEDRSVWEVSEPAEGDVAACRATFGLALTRPASFAVERRRGWTETADSPARAADDMWDERRVDAITLQKARPGADGAMRLTVAGSYFAGFRSALPGHSRQTRYALVDDERSRPLENVQWADWDAEGRLLVATLDGRLQIRAGADFARVAWQVDLASLGPSPAPPPAEAHRW